MGWNTRFTRFGDTHLVFSQDEENSCGMAAMRMCVFKVNKSHPNERMLLSEKELYKSYSSTVNTAVPGSNLNYDGTAYSDARYLSGTLNTLHCGKWETANVGAAGVCDALIDGIGVDTIGLGPFNTIKRGAPIIVLVGWGEGGAHFVVVDTINDWRGKLYASVCDPWDGDVHITPIEKGRPMHYVARNQAFDNSSEKTDNTAGGGWGDRLKHAASLLKEGKTSWSVGSLPHAYSNKTTGGEGDGRGWIVRQVS